MLKRIYIDNYRCFSNFELRPERVNLLLGPNGSGKTSLFDVVAAIVETVRGGQDVAGSFPPSTLTRWDERREQRFELEVELGGRLCTYSLRLHQDTALGRTAIAEERVRESGKTLFAYADGAVHLHRNDGSEGASFAFGQTRSFLAEMQPRPENASLMAFLGFLDGCRTLKLLPGTMRSVTHEESHSLEKSGSNFASWYRHVAQEYAGDLHQLFSRLAEVMPGFQSLQLTGAGKQGRTRDLEARFSGASALYSIDFGDLSDGQRVLVALYTLLLELRVSDRLLLLDEPENYVGLREIQPFLVALDETLGNGSQVFVISHNPEVIDYLAAEHPILITREAGGPARAQDPGFERDSGLLASEQVARGLGDEG